MPNSQFLATLKAVAAGGQRMAAGYGLLLPRPYYEHRMALQRQHWRSTSGYLGNVRTIQPLSESQEQLTPGQAWNLGSLEHHVLLYDTYTVKSGVRLAGGEWFGPYLTADEREYQWFRQHAPELVPPQIKVCSVQRQNFLHRLGLAEVEVVGGRTMSQRYGFYLQRV